MIVSDPNRKTRLSAPWPINPPPGAGAIATPPATSSPASGGSYTAAAFDLRSLDPWGLALLPRITPTARKEGSSTNAGNFWNGLLNNEANHLRALTYTADGKSALVDLAPAETGINAGQLINAIINQSAAGTYAIVANGPGAYIEVYEALIFSTALQTLELFDGTVSLTGPLVGFPAGGGLFLNFTGEPHFILSYGTSLNLALSASAQVSGFVKYRTVSQ